jgi:NitT/TauT family transport system ATP-binding protein
VKDEIRQERTSERIDRGEPVGVDIEVVGVSHDYSSRGKRVHALDEVDLHIQSGEFVVLLGPSGCGKSTLLLIIGGLLRPTTGTVSIGDTRVTKPYTNLGIVFQDPTLLEWRTALRNILIQAEARGIDSKQIRSRALALLTATKLEGFQDSYPSELSGGMKQRVAICRALIHDPPLLLMDEPFAALDAMTREQMAVDLQSLWLEDRKTVVFVTHSIIEAVFLADRIIVFSRRPGRVVDVVHVKTPRPRRLSGQDDQEFNERVRRIRELLGREGVLTE